MFFQQINKQAFVMNDRITFGPTTAPSRETEVKRFESRCGCDLISFMTVVLLYIV